VSLQIKKAEYLLDVGTRMFASKDVNLRPRFSKILQSFYNASIQKMDFSQPAQAAQIVNSWVSEATNGRIKSMFSEGKHTEPQLQLEHGNVRSSKEYRRHIFQRRSLRTSTVFIFIYCRHEYIISY
jgi:hypothetical protein